MPRDPGAAERQRRHRRLARAGKRCVRVPVSAAWLDWLVESGWLEEDEADDWSKVEDATARALENIGNRQNNVTRNAHRMRRLLLSGQK